MLYVLAQLGQPLVAELGLGAVGRMVHHHRDRAAQEPLDLAGRQLPTDVVDRGRDLVAGELTLVILVDHGADELAVGQPQLT